MFTKIFQCFLAISYFFKVVIIIGTGSTKTRNSNMWTSATWRSCVLGKGSLVAMTRCRRNLFFFALSINRKWRSECRLFEKVGKNHVIWTWDFFFCFSHEWKRWRLTKYRGMDGAADIEISNDSLSRKKSWQQIVVKKPWAVWTIVNFISEYQRQG